MTGRSVWEIARRAQPVPSGMASGRLQVCTLIALSRKPGRDGCGASAAHAEGAGSDEPTTDSRYQDRSGTTGMAILDAALAGNATSDCRVTNNKVAHQL